MHYGSDASGDEYRPMAQLHNAGILLQWCTFLVPDSWIGTVFLAEAYVDAGRKRLGML